MSLKELCGEWHLVSTTIHDSVYRNAHINISPEKALFHYFDRVGEGEKDWHVTYHVKSYEGSLEEGYVQFAYSGSQNSTTLDASLKHGEMSFVNENGGVSTFVKK